MRPTPKKINILYFSSFGSLKGGGQRSLYYLLRGLNRERFNPVVVCPEPGDLIEKLQDLGISTRVVPFKRLRNLSFSFAWQIFRLIKKHRIHLVDTDGPVETFYAWIPCRLAGIPLIWHIRVSNPSPLDRLLAAVSTRLIMVASSLRTRFPHCPDHKLAPIINGIDVREFDALPVAGIRKELDLNPSTILIGCIGRIEEMKGQEYLIRAAGILKGLSEDFRILLVGGANDSYWEKQKNLLRELGVEDIFIPLGFRSDSQGIIKELDIVVSASAFGEGLSRVILEAMAAGKPVVSTSVGGAAEAVEDGQNGFIVPPRDPAALARTVAILLNNPEKRQAFGRRGRLRIENEFSLENNISKTERLYLEIIREH